MPLSSQDYWKRPTETVDQYNARIASAQTAGRGLDIPSGASATSLTTPSGGGIGAAVEDLLKRTQKMGTKAFAEQGFNAQAAQYDRLGAKTSADMIGAAPNVQDSVRSNQAAALNPTIQGANSDAQTFSEQLASFKEIANNFQAQQAALKKAAAEKIQNIIDTTGAAGLEVLIKTDLESLKLAGYDEEMAKGLVTALRAQETAGSDDGFTLSPGQIRYDADGNVIAGGGGDPEEEGKAAVRLQYETDRAKRVLGAVDTALGQVSYRTAGFIGNIASIVPGSVQADLASTLDTIKSNIGFQELQAMRAASPTGGALGQVAVQELDMLQAVLGSLKQKQSPEQLRDNLNKIKQHYTAWLTTVRQAGSGGGGGSSITPQEEQELRNMGYPESEINKLKGLSFKTGGRNVPQRNNNPGNLKKGSAADKLAIGVDRQGHLIFPSAQVGLQALKNDITAKVSGNSQAAQRKLGRQARTIADLNLVYAEDPNWKNNVARALGVPTSTALASIPRDKLVNAIMKAEGYFA